jgi:hypothetical protein
MLTLVLVVDIHGDIDESGLERLRDKLSLQKQGRLTDDWDQEFGHRQIDRSGGRCVHIGLFRNPDNSWKLQVLATEKRDPHDPELAALRVELTEAVQAAGFRPEARKKATFG